MKLVTDPPYPRDLGLTYHTTILLQRILQRTIVIECCKQHTSSTLKRVDLTLELAPKGFFNKNL